MGQGARLYDYVGRFMPDGLVGWMMGYRARKDEKILRAEVERIRIPLNHAAVVASGGSGSGSHSGSGAGWGGSSFTSESGIWEKV